MGVSFPHRHPQIGPVVFWHDLVVEPTNGIIPKIIPRPVGNRSAYVVLQIGMTMVSVLVGILDIRRGSGEIGILTGGQTEITIDHVTMVATIDDDAFSTGQPGRQS